MNTLIADRSDSALQPPFSPRYDNFIGGRWVAPAQPRDCAVIDPSTEEACAVISLGGKADTDASAKQSRDKNGDNCFHDLLLSAVTSAVSSTKFYG